jgi:hypothetical protein
VKSAGVVYSGSTRNGRSRSLVLIALKCRIFPPMLSGTLIALLGFHSTAWSSGSRMWPIGPDR